MLISILSVVWMTWVYLELGSLNHREVYMIYSNSWSVYAAFCVKWDKRAWISIPLLRLVNALPIVRIYGA